MKSNCSLISDECIKSVDQFEVTLIKELILYVTLLILDFILLAMIVKKLKRLYQLMDGIIYTKIVILQLRNVNLLLLLTVFFGISQKITQISLFICLQNLSKDTNYSAVMVLYEVLSYSKIFSLLSCIIYSSKLWIKGCAELHNRHYNFYTLVKRIYPYLQYGVLLCYIIILIIYITCCQITYPRTIILLFANLAGFIVLIYACYLFYNQINEQDQQDDLKDFKFQFLIFRWMLAIGVCARILFYLIRLVDDQFMTSLKSFNESTMQNNNSNWFFFELFYQPIVNYSPLFFIYYMFQIRNNDQNVLASQ